jgi:hypothetical protein
MGGKGSGGARKKARPDDKRGRAATKATIREGTGLLLSHVLPDGTADLGRGRAVVKALGRDRLITLPQDDGSEIRILVVSG